MAKNKDVSNALDDLMGASSPVNNEAPVINEPSEEKKRHNIYLNIDDHRKLEKHFKEMRISTSAGIRMILSQYIKDKRL